MATTPDGFLELLTQSTAYGYRSHNANMYAVSGILLQFVKDRDAASPPGSPSDGDLYIVPNGGAANWGADASDYDLAYYYNGSWHFYTPVKGWIKWVDDESKHVYWNGTAWTDL